MTTSSSFDYDAPAINPLFGFQRLAAALAPLLHQKRTESAFVLGIHAPWGAGKTTLMRSISRQFSPTDIVVEFNAWKYDQREALWRALILSVLAKFRENGGEETQIAEMERSLYEHFTVTDKGSLHVNWTAAAATGVQVAIGAVALHFGGGALLGIATGLRTFFGQKKDPDAKAEETAKAIERASTILERKSVDRAVQQVVSIEQFLDRFRDVVQRFGDERRIFVLIDDLDRCLPETALGIFEAIKLFLDAPQCSYVVAVDRAVIRRGLELRYPARAQDEHRTLPPIVDPDEYIEKTITLSVDLPVLSDADGVELLMRGHLAGQISPEDASAIVFVLGTNPRRLLRFGTMLTLWREIAQTLAEKDGHALVFSPLEPANRPLFLKLSLLGYINSGLLAEMRRDPDLSARAQTVCNEAFEGGDQFAQTVAERAGHPKRDAAGMTAASLKNEVPVVAQAMLDPAMLRTLRLEPLLTQSPEKVAVALRWFRSTVTSGSVG